MFHSVVNHDNTHFMEAIKYYIDITFRLVNSFNFCYPLPVCLNLEEDLLYF